MARSKTVWVVINGLEKRSYDSLIAAFTVKHELMTFLERSTPRERDEWWVFRVADGRRSKVENMSKLKLELE